MIIDSIVFAIFSFLLGTIMGSFLLVVATRRQVRSMQGRSKCDHCANTLAWYELIPIGSFLMQGGRCRHCQTRLSSKYVWVEVMVGIAFMVQALVSPNWITYIVGIIAIGLCTVLALYDLKSQYLPTNYLLTLIGLGIVYRIVSVHMLGSVLSPLGYVYLCLPAALLAMLWLVSRGKWIGVGDSILLLGLSLLVGSWQGSMLILLVSSWLGALCGVGWILVQHLEQTRQQLSRAISHVIPYGPAIIGAFFIVWWSILAGAIVIF